MPARAFRRARFSEAAARPLSGAYMELPPWLRVVKNTQLEELSPGSGAVFSPEFLETLESSLLNGASFAETWNFPLFQIVFDPASSLRRA
jgi:hypothetical protein